MPNVERNVVKPPNEETPAGNRANNGFLPLTRGAVPFTPPNEAVKSDRRNGSFSLAEQATPVDPPNHRFQVENAMLAWPPAATEPGKGAVPVGPFSSTGFPRSAATLKDANPK